MANSAPSKTQERRVFEYDAQYLFLVPELAEQLHEEALLMRVPVVLDLAALTRACRSRVLAEAVAAQAGFQLTADRRLIFPAGSAHHHMEPRTLSVGNQWVAQVLDELTNWFRRW